MDPPTTAENRVSLVALPPPYAEGEFNHAFGLTLAMQREGVAALTMIAVVGFPMAVVFVAVGYWPLAFLTMVVTMAYTLVSGHLAYLHREELAAALASR